METILPLWGKDTEKHGGQLYPEKYFLKGKDFWSLYDFSVGQILIDSDNIFKIVATYFLDSSFPVALL